MTAGGTLPPMIDLDVESLRDVAGIGVAGNVAGHLEQAGEASDFTNVAAAAGAPKGIFPWYLPGAASFLGAFPLSHDRLVAPRGDGPVNLQIEPEVGVLFRVAYDDAGRVAGLRPLAAGAFDDCSIRRPGAPKISEKKNWGPCSKGVAARMFPVTDLAADGALRTLRIASFLRRDGAVHPYGLDSPAAGYSYAGARLVDWIADRLRTQEGSPDTPLEPVGAYLAAAGHPGRALIGIGATRYTRLGETTFLRPGDHAVVVVYDAAVTAPDAVRDAVERGREASLAAASVLVQAVEREAPAQRAG